eukprot:1386421-Amphidinium_carterae.1
MACVMRVAISPITHERSFGAVPSIDLQWVSIPKVRRRLPVKGLARLPAATFDEALRHPRPLLEYFWIFLVTNGQLISAHVLWDFKSLKHGTALMKESANYDDGTSFILNCVWFWSRFYIEAMGVIDFVPVFRPSAIANVAKTSPCFARSDLCVYSPNKQMLRFGTTYTWCRRVLLTEAQMREASHRTMLTVSDSESMHEPPMLQPQ